MVCDLTCLQVPADGGGALLGVIEVVNAERPHHDQLSLQSRLPVHHSSPSSSHSRQTHSLSRPLSALSAAGTIVTPHREQIGGPVVLTCRQYVGWRASRSSSCLRKRPHAGAARRKQWLVEPSH